VTLYLLPPAFILQQQVPLSQTHRLRLTEGRKHWYSRTRIDRVTSHKTTILTLIAVVISILTSKIHSLFIGIYHRSTTTCRLVHLWFFSHFIYRNFYTRYLHLIRFRCEHKTCYIPSSSGVSSHPFSHSHYTSYSS
jgi:hypothetical protein